MILNKQILKSLVEESIIELAEEADRKRVNWKNTGAKSKDAVILNDDGTISIKGNVNLSNRGLTRLPYKYKEVTGSFDISNNNLKSLSNTPRKIGGNFNASKNQLKSLSNGPEVVKGSYTVNNMPTLASLRGAPEKVNIFKAIGSGLRSANYGPKTAKSIQITGSKGKQFKPADILKYTKVAQKNIKTDVMPKPVKKKPVAKKPVAKKRMSKADQNKKWEIYIGVDDYEHEGDSERKQHDISDAIKNAGLDRSDFNFKVEWEAPEVEYDEDGEYDYDRDGEGTADIVVSGIGLQNEKDFEAA
jgi:hypothetical protein